MKSEDEKPDKSRISPSWLTAALVMIFAGIVVAVILFYRSGNSVGSLFENDIVVFVSAFAAFAGILLAIISHTDRMIARGDARAAEDRRRQDAANEAHRLEVATDRRKQQASLDAHRKEQQASLDAHRRETARDRRKQQHTLDAHQRQHQKLMQEFKKEMSRFGERQSHLEGKSQS